MLGKYNRWVQFANILCGPEGLAVPAPELHINTQMRSGSRSNITGQSGVDLLVYLRKHHFIIKTISPSGENMEWAPSVGREENKWLSKDGG